MRAACFILAIATASACSSNNASTTGGGTGGSSGTTDGGSGAAGTTSSAGASGSAGTSGSAGAGAGGAGGGAGMAGTSGTAGAAGVDSGAEASAGAAGTAGSAGSDAGIGGAAGSPMDSGVTPTACAPPTPPGPFAHAYDCTGVCPSILGDTTCGASCVWNPLPQGYSIGGVCGPIEDCAASPPVYTYSSMASDSSIILPAGNFGCSVGCQQKYVQYAIGLGAGCMRVSVQPNSDRLLQTTSDTCTSNTAQCVSFQPNNGTVRYVYVVAHVWSQPAWLHIEKTCDPCP